jgi:hypothetical protein
MANVQENERQVAQESGQKTTLFRNIGIVRNQ